MGRYGEIWGDTGRYGEIRGDMGSSRAPHARGTPVADACASAHAPQQKPTAPTRRPPHRCCSHSVTRRTSSTTEATGVETERIHSTCERVPEKVRRRLQERARRAERPLHLTRLACGAVAAVAVGLVRAGGLHGARATGTVTPRSVKYSRMCVIVEVQWAVFRISAVGQRDGEPLDGERVTDGA